MHRTRHYESPETGKHIEEKGKAPNKKAKLLLTTVRDAVFAILDGRTSVSVRGYEGDIDQLHLTKKSPIRKKDITVDFPQPNPRKAPKDQKKESIHTVLDAVGITKKNTNKRIRSAVETLEKQYQHMSMERFLHRLDNGKIERDVRFLFGNMHLFMSFGPEAMRSTLDNFFASGNFQGLKTSPSLRTIKTMIRKAKDALRDNEINESDFIKFKEVLYVVARGFSKELTSSEI